MPDALDADIVACARLIRGGSRSFHAASLLLPRRVRAPAYALYAFCRLADDAVDLGGGSAALDALRRRLDDLYAGRPAPIAADRAMAAVVREFAIPIDLPAALLEGFAWDLAGRRYADLPQLRAYAARVAGSVGAMMALLMETRDEDSLARAGDLGMAMQLSNIVRDVGEDAAAGRLYLPLDWLAAAGIDAERFLARPVFDARLAGIVSRLVQAADQHYRRADPAITRLPFACRPGIAAARWLYAEIGNEVLRQGGDSVTRRAVVSGRRKVWRLTQAVGVQLALTVLAGRSGSDDVPTHELRFLVEAVRCSPVAAPRKARSFDEEAGWVIDLFHRLEREARLEQQRSRA
ncbi:phytoene/squalene synthase family protein [Dongia mobilis]|uniref:phytoene/squalene synthase family protein n=1 Tax=Dongia mobilis TaxID=578943 RepID=UPI001FB60641|nr:phytoene/squalene synthase family protein [Dongia mobilis]